MQNLVAFGSDLVEVGDRLRESDTAVGVPLDPGDDLVDGRGFGQPGQLGRQVALQRGPAGTGPLGELAVDRIGEVAYEHMRHVFIMQASAGIGNSRLRAGAGSLTPMDRPPPDPRKLLDHWMEWERGETPPGRVMSDLKTGGIRELLQDLAAAAGGEGS